jgi:streptogramin lyase
MRTPASAAVLLCSLATLTTLSAQTFSNQVFLQGLASPTGITLAPNGDLYFTEVPTPGVAGAASQNTVRVRNAQTGAISTIAMGEPEPVNLALSGSDVFWTCKSAGVVIRRQNGTNAPWRTGLQSPSGIAAAPNGDILITQVPTPGLPGTMGGMNTVARIVGTGAPMPITTGEPEPVDIAVDNAGNAYWTCRTAGVILRNDAATGMTSLVLNGLDQPTGIDIDDDGNLYFTEVPTPGVPGTMGGQNKVWKYSPATKQFTLISVGEPEPTDITVAGDGSAVYWTCTSAGVILRAMRTGNQPELSTPGVTAIGQTVRFFLDAPGAGGNFYALGNSLGRGPTPVGTGYLALEQDFLLAATFSKPDSPLLVGYFGLLDLNGMGTAHLVIPAIPELQGLVFYTAYGVLDATSVLGLSKTLRTVIQ